MRDDSDSRVSIRESTATTSSSRNRLSRRRFLEATAAATAITSVSGIAAAQDGTGTETPTPTPTDGGGGGGQAAETFELGGTAEAWQGRSPDSIADQQNPTLELQAGQTYTVIWENMDGAQHNFVLLDQNDEAIDGTELMGEQGQTQEFTFDATEEMVAYYCEVHPEAMRGEVNVSAGDGGTGTETGTPTPTEEGTPTPTEEATPTPTEEASPTPAGDGGDGGGGGGADQPGFGVIAALSGLAGAGAYLRRRMKRNEK